MTILAFELCWCTPRTKGRELGVRRLLSPASRNKLFENVEGPAVLGSSYLGVLIRLFYSGRVTRQHNDNGKIRFMLLHRNSVVDYGDTSLLMSHMAACTAFRIKSST